MSGRLKLSIEQSKDSLANKQVVRLEEAINKSEDSLANKRVV